MEALSKVQIARLAPRQPGANPHRALHVDARKAAALLEPNGLAALLSRP